MKSNIVHLDSFLLGIFISSALILIGFVVFSAYSFSMLEVSQIVAAYGATAAFLIALVVHLRHALWRQSDRAEKRSLFYLNKHRDALSEIFAINNVSTLSRTEVNSSVSIIAAIKDISILVTEAHHKQLQRIEEIHARRLMRGIFSCANLTFLIGLEMPLDRNKYSDYSDALNHELQFRRHKPPIFVNKNTENPKFSNDISEEYVVSILQFLSDLGPNDLLTDQTSNLYIQCKTDFPALSAIHDFLRSPISMDVKVHDNSIEAQASIT